MEKCLRHFIPSWNEHLSDDRLASLICGELSLWERWGARQHLATCWHCRLRKDELEGRRADDFFEGYLKIRRKEKLPKEPEMEFSHKLRLQIQSTAPKEEKAIRFPRIPLPELSFMNPALVTAIVCGFVAFLSLAFWWQQRSPQISSNALLVQAEKWDTPSLASALGVVYQPVRITLSKQSKKATIDRSIYRDTQGKRQPKQVKLDAAEQQLQDTLTEAGLDWNEPLSASGYQNWHDRQRVREDNIVRAGSHLLRLTTTDPDGLVAEQSLTVRDTDFHPVKRTVELRDNSTVEIAELDFKILPWSAVDANVFEPFGNAASSIAANSARVLPFPRLPEVLTEGQRDEAELGARLILNQLHADSGAQIEILRGPQSITVNGLVETEEQRRGLQARLQMVPHVTPSIQSAENIRRNPSLGDSIQSLAVASMPDQPSPLKTYLQARGRSVAEINDLGQRLFNSVLTVSQESKEIADLQARFGPEEHRTALASATLAELMYSHRQRLDAALKHERELLAETQSAPVSGQAAAARASSLFEAADRNLSLAKELTQTHSPAVRSADKILAEMSVTMDDLATRLHESYGKSQSNSALGGKK